jgi:MarR family transcriptional regulator for hemolysin
MDLEEQYTLALSQLSRTWRSRLDERLKGLGLTQARWIALVQLSRLEAGIRQGELADQMAIEGPTLVRLLDRLEAQGLVERRPDTNGDRRVKRIYLTAEAGPLLEQINRIGAELRTEVMAAVDRDDLRASLRVFAAIECALAKP